MRPTLRACVMQATSGPVVCCYAWPRAPSSAGLAGGSRRTSDVGPWDCPLGGLVLVGLAAVLVRWSGLVPVPVPVPVLVLVPEPLLVLTPGGWSQLVDAVSLCG